MLQLEIQGDAPPPVPVKTSHIKDGHHPRRLIFHVSCPPPPPRPSWIRCCADIDIVLFQIEHMVMANVLKMNKSLEKLQIKRVRNIAVMYTQRG